MATGSFWALWCVLMVPGIQVFNSEIPPRFPRDELNIVSTASLLPDAEIYGFQDHGSGCFALVCPALSVPPSMTGSLSVIEAE